MSTRRSPIFACDSSSRIGRVGDGGVLATKMLRMTTMVDDLLAVYPDLQWVVTPDLTTWSALGPKVAISKRQLGFDELDNLYFQTSLHSPPPPPTTSPPHLATPPPPPPHLATSPPPLTQAPPPSPPPLTHAPSPSPLHCVVDAGDVKDNGPIPPMLLTVAESVCGTIKDALQCTYEAADCVWT